jgi:hypothetical protein
MNGPMNGSLNMGPAIDPLFLRYITAQGQQLGMSCISLGALADTDRRLLESTKL